MKLQQIMASQVSKRLYCTFELFIPQQLLGGGRMCHRDDIRLFNEVVIFGKLIPGLGK